MKKFKRIYLLLCILLLIIISIVFVGLLINQHYLIKKPTPTFSNPIHQQVFQKWFGRIQKVGGKQAYLEFSMETDKKSIDAAHADAHLFGEALYQIEGDNGFSVCDDKFSYGCYHSFLGSAITAEGIEVIPVLNQKCFDNMKKNGLACQHGIGHGVLSSIGYDLESLKQALVVCDQLPIKDPIGGCFGGVFMEFNYQTLLLDAGNTRKYDEAEPYYPCFSIDEKFRPACLYQQANWWIVSLDLSSEQKYKKIDNYCQSLENEEYQVQCFKGFGLYLTSDLNYDYEKAKSVCKSLFERKSQLLCLSGFAISLISLPKTANIGHQVCLDKTLTKEEQQFCKLHSDQNAGSSLMKD